MRRMRMLAVTGALAIAGSAVGATVGGTGAVAAPTQARTFQVLADSGVTAGALSRTLTRAGAQVVRQNTAIGLVTVTSTDAGFAARARRLAGVAGAAADRSIATAPSGRQVKPHPVEKEHVFTTSRANGTGQAVPAPPEGQDPLDGLLWGMKMINAFEAHAIERGGKVRVGILDTGVDGSHLDIAPNFDAKLSRNFTHDIEAIDGPCEYVGCVDPANVDDDGHGTHVAGTIGAALNGVGVSGVAPEATLVNIRGGQDSGYFFLAPVVDALTYAGNEGLDVVNMSFYVDPWLYNCAGGAPQDQAVEAVAEQNMIIEAMTRALGYATGHGVALVGALGNDHDDLSKPRTDLSSPDYDNPLYDWDSAPYARTIGNATCLNLPVEGPDVIGVSAVGPSGTKSDFSNYTTDLDSGEIEVSAPGGWFRDGFGTSSFRTNGNLILSAAPLNVLQSTGEVDKNGNITAQGRDSGVLKNCTNDKQNENTASCAYYQWLQGTSMAAPHASGVAALVVAAHGEGTSVEDFGLASASTRALLMNTATNHACPAGGVRSYVREGRSGEYTATCVGDADFNGFYGDGIVNALGAVLR